MLKIHFFEVVTINFVYHGIHVVNIEKFGSYLTENKLRLRYKHK